TVFQLGRFHAQSRKTRFLRVSYRHSGPEKSPVPRIPAPDHSFQVLAIVMRPRNSVWRALGVGWTGIPSGRGCPRLGCRHDQVESGLLDFQISVGGVAVMTRDASSQFGITCRCYRIAAQEIAAEQGIPLVHSAEFANLDIRSPLSGPLSEQELFPVFVRPGRKGRPAVATDLRRNRPMNVFSRLEGRNDPLR